MSLFEEIKRRNVFRVAFAYIIISWIVMQVADVILNNIEAPVWIFQVILLLLGIGFLFALFFSWAFEMTPEGLKREHEVDRSHSITSQTGEKLNKLIVVIMALGLVYFSIDKFVLDSQRTVNGQQQAESTASGGQLPGRDNQSGVPESPDEIPYIAVLPFANLSGDPANVPFTLGIHDDLLTHLAHISALKTISRTSVLQYKDTTKTIPQIAAELGVSIILEGGIQRSGNQVRMNLQLINAETDEHLWAEIYDRELTAENLFAVQGDIATEVVKSLRATLLPEEEQALAQAPTQSMAAYDLYLLGRHHWNERTAESIEMARDYFTRAIEEDPNYVLALSGLADSYTLLVSYGNMKGSEAFPTAQDAVERAMSLDDSVSEVWASKGLLLLQQQNFPEAEQALGHALELDELNFPAWLWYGNTMSRMRRFEEQLEALQTAYELEPMSRPINNNLAYSYMSRGNFVRSRQHFERVDQIDDLNPTEFKEQIAETYYWSGEIARAIAEARQILAIDPANIDVMIWLITSYLDLGDFQEAKTWADRASSLFSIYPFAGELYEAQGDFDGNIVYLEDKLGMLGDRNDMGFLFGLFRTAYLGDRIETAKSYLGEYLTHLGGRPEVNPSANSQWDQLLIADFWIKHGDASADEPRHGQDLRDEILAALSALNAQGFEHPATWYGLAMARAMQGDDMGALDALDQAVQNGFVRKTRLIREPSLSRLLNTERFEGITARIDSRIASEREQLSQTTLAQYVVASDQGPVLVSRDILENYAGYYSDGNAVLHYFFDEKGQFSGRFGQMRAFAWLASSEDEFYIPGMTAFSAKFHLDESGVVSHVMVSGGGGVQRLKATAAPPTPIELSRTTLERYLGTYAVRLNSGAQDGGTDSDIWTAVVKIDGDGKVWLDFDNQPQLEFLPFSETEFFIPGFESRMRFEFDEGSEVANRMISIQDGVVLEFKRQ